MHRVDKRKPATEPIKVIVVDDSAVMRRLLTDLMNAMDGIEVVGSAADGEAALELIALVKPDVVTLDVAMPKMDGLEVLRRLMASRPVPVVMVSAFTERASETTMRALELGAVDFIGKPVRDAGEKSFSNYSQELGELIRAANGARIRPSVARFPSQQTSKSAPAKSLPSGKPEESGGTGGGGRVSTPVPVNTSKRPLPLGVAERRPSVIEPKAAVVDAGPAPVRPVASSTPPRRVICIGASTGGTEALKQLLLGFPADCPPTLIVQHMPEAFTGSFAKRLDGMCLPTVIESKGGEPLQNGVVYIAPGHSHMRVRKSGSGWVTELNTEPPVNRHRPSVDVLFDSAAELIGGSAIGVILTGMGRDGAQGLLRMRQAKAVTYGQDEATCVVYGMPREAALLGAVGEVVSIDDMAKQIFAGLARA